MNLERIRNLREDHDLSQQEIAQRFNISQRAYSHYEIGSREIPLNLLMELADFYGTSTDYLLSRTNIKDPYPKNPK